MTPLPMMTMPPQSPGFRCPGALADVNTIGCVAVPFASIRAPRRIQSELPGVAASPTILVPGWIVSTAPLWTLM
ncbi:hypothetical protein D3C83_216450 [compost metagenome]